MKITVSDIQRINLGTLELGYNVVVESDNYRKESNITHDYLHGSAAYNQSIFGDHFEDCDWKAVTDSDTPMRHVFVYSSFEEFDNAGWENKQLKHFVWDCEDELN